MLQLKRDRIRLPKLRFEKRENRQITETNWIYTKKIQSGNCIAIQKIFGEKEESGRFVYAVKNSGREVMCRLTSRGFVCL